MIFTSDQIGQYLKEWRSIENTHDYKMMISDDEHKRRLLSYAQGGSDIEMANRIGLSQQAYNVWRRRNNLPPRGREVKSGILFANQAG